MTDIMHQNGDTGAARLFFRNGMSLRPKGFNGTRHEMERTNGMVKAGM